MNPRLVTQVEWNGRRGASLRGLVGAAPVRLSRAGVRIAFGEAAADGTMCIAGARWRWAAADELDGSREDVHASEVEQGGARVRGVQASGDEQDGSRVRGVQASGVEQDGTREDVQSWAAAGGKLGGSRVREVQASRGAADELVQESRGEGRVSLREALLEACARVPAGRVALALSGGVDSAVLAALLRDRVAVYTLESGLAGYCEVDETQRVADRLGLELRRVRVDAEALVQAVPAVIRACETPLYNLHPVSRHLLARAVRADGFDVLITGDGADEVFGGTNGGDYLPVVGALTRAAGLTAWAPFLDPGVAASVERDAGKRALRALAIELGVPAEVATRAKRPRFAPALDLERYRDEARVTELGRWLGLVPSWAADRSRVGWTTLALFCEDYPGLERCAA